MRTVAVISNTSWSIFNFRAGLIAHLIGAGYRVVAVAPPDSYSARIPDLGCTYVSLPMDNKGRNPLRDLLMLLRLFVIFAREKPSYFLGFTIKPNIYGSIVARFFGVPAINNIAGLGSVFVNPGVTQRLVRTMYRGALARSKRVF